MHRVLDTQYSVLGTNDPIDPKHDSAVGPSRSAAIELTAEMVQGVHVIARADKLVDCPDNYRPLVTRFSAARSSCKRSTML